MAGGKRPSFRLVLGKRTIGVLWTAESKTGLAYHSGELDVTALRAAVKEQTLKSKSVRVNAEGKTEMHDVCRLAMFDAATPKGGASKKSGDDF
jgi:uncharacterized protein (DUF736 family)